MARRPDPVLLSDGDLLVPVRSQSGPGWEMLEINHGSNEYASWLLSVQDAQVRTISRGIWRFMLQYLAVFILIAVAVGAIVVILVNGHVSFGSG
jgi:hypothetical protein